MRTSDFEPTLDQLLEIAERFSLEPCDYCKHRAHVGECASTNPNGGSEPPCVNDPEVWVDEDALVDLIYECEEAEYRDV